MESSITNVAIAYGQAWNDRDVEAIVSLHSTDSTLEVHGLAPVAKGHDEIRATLRSFFEAWQDSVFERRSVFFGSEHWVSEWTVHATPSGPIEIGGKVLDLSKSELSMDGADVIHVRDGKVVRKSSYIDLSRIFDADCSRATRANDVRES